MAALTDETWLVLAGIGIATIGSILYTLSVLAERAIRVHDLRLRVHVLHQEYLQRLESMRNPTGNGDSASATPRLEAPARKAA